MSKSSIGATTSRAARRASGQPATVVWLVHVVGRVVAPGTMVGASDVDVVLLPATLGTVEVTGGTVVAVADFAARAPQPPAVIVTRTVKVTAVPAKSPGRRVVTAGRR